MIGTISVTEEVEDPIIMTDTIVMIEVIVIIGDALHLQPTILGQVEDKTIATVTVTPVVIADSMTVGVAFAEEKIDMMGIVGTTILNRQDVEGEITIEVDSAVDLQDLMEMMGGDVASITSDRPNLRTETKKIIMIPIM